MRKRVYLKITNILFKIRFNIKVHCRVDGINLNMSIGWIVVNQVVHGKIAPMIKYAPSNV